MDNLESAPQPRPNIADPDNFDVPSQAFINFQYDSLIPYFQKLSVFFPGMVASSSSSISLTPGNKTIEIEPGKVFPAGSGVRVTNAANINQYFIASVVDYDDVTGDFEFSPSTIVGTGTFSNWQIISTTLNGNLQAAINEKRATVAATATTTPLWTAVNGNVQDWTGTPTITNFPAAPQAGASRVVYPAAGTIFTNNADIRVQGSANYTVEAGDRVEITAVDIDTFDVVIQKKSGAAVLSLSAGAVQYFAKNTPPTGWLKANGALVSRTTYAALFAEIGTMFGAGDGSTTFGLPDLRGEFIRGWDDGRGADSGRAFGSAQADELKSHQHTMPNQGSVSSNTTGAGIGTFNGASTTYQTADTGGPETRPRNVALLACIKF